MIQAHAILLAAGKGARLKSRRSKPLVEVGGRPLVWYSLNVLQALPTLSEIVLVANTGNRRSLSSLVRKWGFTKVRSVVLGGRQRSDSVRCGLKALSPRAQIVLIHDAARPFIDGALATRLIHSAQRYGAAIPGVPVKATIKKVKSKKAKGKSTLWVKETVDRHGLWEIQTPQVFKRDLLVEAFATCGRAPVTDDAMLVERIGRPVAVVEGSYANIKITTPEDIAVARAFAGSGIGTRQ